MRKFLSLLMMLVVAIGAFAAEAVYYTLDGSVTGGTNGYATDSEITQSDMDWLVTGNTTVSPWRLGGKNLTGVDRDVKATTAMGSAITKVALEVGTKTLMSVNSITLTVASDAAFSNVLDTKSASYEASSTIEFTPTTGTEWATGAYYMITFNVTSGSSNQYVQFINAKFYKNDGGETPVDPVVLTAPTFSPEAGEVESGTTVTITAPEGYYVSYTTNGDDPTKNGTLSENNVATVTVTEAITIKAATADDDLNFSDVVEAAYTIAQTTPDDPTPGEGTVTVWSEDWESTDFGGAATAAVSSVQNANATYSASTGNNTKVYNSGGPNSNANLLLAKSSANDTFTANIALNGVSGDLTLTWSQSGSGKVGSITSTVSGVTVGTISNEGTTITVPSGTTTLDLTFANSGSSNMRIDDLKLVGENGGETPEPQVTVATPVITAEGSDGQNKAGEWIDSADVTITCSTEGASIYYTTDGTEPTDQSTLWNGTPFTLTATATVKAIAYVDGTASEVASLEVLIGEADPVTPPSDYVDDEIVRSTLDFGSATTGYNPFTTATLASGAQYAGQAFAGNNDAIQLRTSSSNEGIVSTVSGGKIRKVTLSWNSSTNSARKVAVYASNTAYTDASDLYGDNAGTKIGELGTTETELEITDDYDYVGIRSTGSALYLDGVTFSWEPAEAPAVATPVITSADETVVGPQTISITCATEGADVYYTIDGTEPSASSTLYEGAFQLTASATVKAIAILGNDQSAVASKAFTINVATSVAEAAALDLTADKGKEFVIEFNEAKVIYVTSNKTFLREGDNAILLYNLSSLGLNLNDVVSGTILVKFNPYNNLPEWISTTGTSADNLTITPSDEAAQPIPATAAEIAAGSYLCNLVKLTGVKVVKDGTNYYASEDGGTTLLFQIRDNYGTGALSVFETTTSNGARRKAEAVGGDEGFDIEGIVEVYNSTIQLAPTSATSIVTGVEDLAAEKNVASVKYFNLLGVESAEPFQGVNVVVTTYTDGSKTARKVVK